MEITPTYEIVSLRNYLGASLLLAEIPLNDLFRPWNLFTYLFYFQGDRSLSSFFVYCHALKLIKRNCARVRYRILVAAVGSTAFE